MHFTITDENITLNLFSMSISHFPDICYTIKSFDLFRHKCREMFLISGMQTPAMHMPRHQVHSRISLKWCLNVVTNVYEQQRIMAVKSHRISHRIVGMA